MKRTQLWPDSNRELLLGVCFHPDPAVARELWKKWRSRVDLDDLDHGSFEIMSLVCLRLLDLGIDDPDLQRIKGLHRFRWARSRLASVGARELVRTLREAGIRVMIFNTIRGMQETGFIVPFEDAARAVELLENRGWSATPLDPTGMTPCAVTHPDRTTVLIHSRILQSPGWGDGDDALWQAARPWDYEGTQVLAPDPADQFLRACERGLVDPPGSHWLVDVTLILRHSPSFDWDRFAARAARYWLCSHARRTLLYLRKHWEPSIPGETIARLSRFNRDQKIGMFLAKHPRAGFLQAAGRVLRRYLHLRWPGRVRHFRYDTSRFLGSLRRRARQVFSGGVRRKAPVRADHPL